MTLANMSLSVGEGGAVVLESVEPDDSYFGPEGAAKFRATVVTLFRQSEPLA